MAAIQVAEGSAHAQAIQSAVQARLIEINWAPEENDSTLSDYITMMLVHGRDENAIKAELAGDLLGIGEEDPMVPEFTSWLFNTAASLAPQQSNEANGHTQGQDSSLNTEDAQMDDAGAAGAGGSLEGAPSGPKAMRNGRGRGGRMLNSMNRQMDRGQDMPDSLRRIKGAAGGQGGRINAHANRDAPRGPRNQNLANGVQRMMNGRNQLQNNPMMQQGGMLANLDPQNQMMFMQMMEMQAKMMQQMSQGHMSAGGPGGFQPGGFGKSSYDKRGHNKLRNNHNKADGESGMDVDAGDKKSLFDTMCRFNDKCTNPDCGFAHQSPATTKPGQPIDMNDTCKFGAKCTNFKCAGRHPSPCLSEAWQQRQQQFYGGQKYQETTICRFYPNCTRGDDCPYLHSDAAQNTIACRYTPCTKPNCPFVHAEGQQQAPKNVWTANTGEGGKAENGSATKADRFAGFKENEGAEEELIKPNPEAASMDTSVPT